MPCGLWRVAVCDYLHAPSHSNIHHLLGSGGEQNEKQEYNCKYS